MHQPRDVLEADVAAQQLLVVEHAHAAVRADLVAIEREIDFFDAVALRGAPNAASAPGAPPLNRMQSAAVIGRCYPEL